MPDVMQRRITIDPITRLEGHGKIDILLNDEGKVDRAYFQVPELRGFEKFAEGRLAERSVGWVTEIDLVKGVEQLPSELQPQAFLHGDVLQNGEVPGVIIRAAIVGKKTADVAEAVRRCVNEGRGVKPAVNAVFLAARRPALHAR